MQKKSRSKRKRLYFQISVMLLPIFALMTAAILGVMYISSINSFLEAQNEYMKNETDTTYQNLVPDEQNQFVLLQEYFEQNPAEIDAPLTAEERRVYDEALEAEGTIEENMKSSALLRRAWAKKYIEYFTSFFESEYSVLGRSKFSHAFIMDGVCGLFFCQKRRYGLYY